MKYMKTFFVLSVFTTVINVCFLFMGAARYIDPEPGVINAKAINLVSPDERFSIRIEATPQGAGFWMTDQRQGNAVSIYNGHNQGAVVGVYGPKVEKDGKKVFDWQALCAALSATENGGQIQMLKKVKDEDGDTHQKLYFLDAKGETFNLGH